MNINISFFRIDQQYGTASPARRFGYWMLELFFRDIIDYFTDGAHKFHV
jgi:hypothetical protein